MTTAATEAPAGDGFTQLINPDLDRIELVGKAANGHVALIAKEADAVADSASDGASTAEGGETKPDESVGAKDAKADTQAAGAGADGATAADIAKAEEDDLEDKPEDVDLTLPLAAGTTDGVIGDELVPGSPAWESVDAASARKWTAVLYRVKNALGVLAEREGIEAATGDFGDGYDNQWNLEDAACAIDFAVGTLATYAASEENEAVTGTEAIAAVGKGAVDVDRLTAIAKAATSIDLDALAVVEELAPIAKAGRVLSAGNETKIRDAVGSLQSVLDTLPAPVDDVAKETAVTPAAPTIEELIADVAKEQEAAAAADAVAKADDPLAKTSEDDLRRMAISGSGSDQKNALQELGTRFLMGTLGTAPGDEGADAADDTDAAADLTPAPDAAVGEGSTAPTAGATDDAIAKSAVDIVNDLIAAKVSEMLDERDVVAKQQLEDRLGELAGPARTRVLSNGATPDAEPLHPLPPAHIMRGQNRGQIAPTTSVAKAALTAETDVVKRREIADGMEAQAAEALRQIHAQARR